MGVEHIVCFAYRLFWDVHPALCGADDGPRSEEGRYEPAARPEHHVDGLVIKEDAMFDRTHAVTDRGLDPIGCLRVRHDEQAGRACLGHKDLQFVVAEVCMPGIISW